MKNELVAILNYISVKFVTSLVQKLAKIVNQGTDYKSVFLPNILIQNRKNTKSSLLDNSHLL